MAQFQPQQFIAGQVRDIPRSGIREFFDIVQTMPDVISLGVGEPDFVTPWHIREAAIYALERGKTSYTSNLGLLKLRQAISGYVEKQFGVPYDPGKQILVTVGVSEALDIALRAVVNPGDQVLYHEPCYVSYSPSISMAHGVPVPVPCLAEHEFALTAEAIEQAITPRAKVVVLNFPTNPTGGTMTRAELLKIADVVLRHNLLVITDEIYAELTFEGEHISIASLPGMYERTIPIYTMSKTYAITGLRLGYIAVRDQKIRERARKVLFYTVSNTSSLVQYGAVGALAGSQQAVQDFKQELLQRRTLFYDGVKNAAPGVFSGAPPAGAFYAFLKIDPAWRSPLPDAPASQSWAMTEFLIKKGRIGCVPGADFGSVGEGYVRFCFARDRAEINGALASMEEIIEMTRTTRMT